MAGGAIAGLILLSVGYIGAAIVAGMYYGPDAGTNWLNGAFGLRIGPSIVETITTLGFLVLALAAWTKVRRLAGQEQPVPATPPQPS
jgi:hypothetical protein